jgi:hypothetical protein
MQILQVFLPRQLAILVFVQLVEDALHLEGPMGSWHGLLESLELIRMVMMMMMVII